MLRVIFARSISNRLILNNITKESLCYNRLQVSGQCSRRVLPISTCIPGPLETLIVFAVIFVTKDILDASTEVPPQLVAENGGLGCQAFQGLQSKKFAMMHV